MSGLLARDRPLLVPTRPGRAAAAAELLFQPRYSLLDRTLKALEATSARLRPRLHHGLPGRDTRDIGRDSAMLRDACRLASGWRGTTLPVLSLRVTEAQAASGLLARVIAEVLCDSGLAPERMELEFSENSLKADECDLLYLLAALRDLGVGLVLGGFGSGVSSLTLLRRRSVAGLLSGVKLDQLLVHEPAEDHDGFLHGLAESAHALGLLVIAEGIESETQCQRLSQAGCDQGLGAWLGDAGSAMDYAEAALSAVQRPAAAATPDVQERLRKADDQGR